jgi:uncharacterized protein (DUF1786 family)
MKDFDFQMIEEAFSVFDVDLKGLSAVAVGVFDHGDAPPGYSDRQFRFDYLDERIRISNKLSGFAYRSPDVPEIMTRLQAVVDSSKKIVDVPLVVMDTAPAAVLGATYDVQVKGRERVLIANVGNFHTLAFRLGGNGIEGVFEHHTGLLDTQKLDSLLYRLADNTLTHEEVFNSHGHGALIYTKEPFKFPKDSYQVVLTGPRRSLMNSSSLSVHYAAPFGDMMISGCFGLLSAVADLIPELAEPIYSSLNAQGGSETAPWDSE